MPTSNRNMNHLPDTVSREEQLELAKLIQKGVAARKLLAAESGEISATQKRQLREEVRQGEAAFTDLYTSNLKLVAHWSGVYAQKIPVFAKSVVDRDDLFSEGTLGLYRACQKFDPSKGYAFSTYASYWIRQSIARGIENASAIRVPAYLIADVRTALSNDEGEDLSQSVLDGVQALKVRSLDAQIAEDFTLADTVVADGIGPEEELFAVAGNSTLYEDVEQILQTFSERDQRIMRLRMGIGETPSSYREISREVGIGPNGVRYVVNRRFCDIRRALTDMGYSSTGVLAA